MLTQFDSRVSDILTSLMRQEDEEEDDVMDLEEDDDDDDDDDDEDDEEDDEEEEDEDEDEDADVIGTGDEDEDEDDDDYEEEEFDDDDDDDEEDEDEEGEEAVAEAEEDAPTLADVIQHVQRAKEGDVGWFQKQFQKRVEKTGLGAAIVEPRGFTEFNAIQPGSRACAMSGKPAANLILEIKTTDGPPSRVYIKRKYMRPFCGLYHLACLAHPKFADYKTVAAHTLAASFIHAARTVDEFFKEVASVDAA